MAPPSRHAAVAAGAPPAGRNLLQPLAARAQRVRARTRRFPRTSAAQPKTDGASESREDGKRETGGDDADSPPPTPAAAAAVDPVSTERDDGPSSMTAEASSSRGQALSAKQVRALLTTICEETDIAELRFGYGEYELNVRRRVSPLANGGAVYQSNGSAGGAAGAAPTAAPAPAAAAEPMAVAVGTASLMEESIDEEATFNESLIYIESPKVGLMRRGLFNKNGKKIGAGPDTGDLVKKGQTLCFIEQLGTFAPVIAPQQGEVAEFLIKDGAPVEYLEPVVELAPYFGGHIIGDMKYA